MFIAKRLPQKNNVLQKEKDTGKDTHKWSKKTTVIEGDSTISGVNEYYLSNKGKQS